MNQPVLLGIDAGTTHCKAALFGADGRMLSMASRPSPIRTIPGSFDRYEPGAFWHTICAVVREAVQTVPDGQIAGVGITSMAETGLLVDLISGEPRTPLIPWFDTSANSQAQRLAGAGDPQQLFFTKGIYPNFKCSLAKILWLRDEKHVPLAGAVWLSTADYLAYRLTGAFVTDYSLAGRTYAFDIHQLAWDENWLGLFGLDTTLFPPAQPSGAVAGRVTPTASNAAGLPAGIPVSVAGHDHVCGALAFGVTNPQVAFDSMGTAEALVGAFPRRPLGTNEFQSGFTFGCHVAENLNYWMGGLSTSGGSIEWLRRILGDPALSYSDLDGIIATLGPEPGELLYFPYLAGSGAPHSDPLARGAFIGLSASHGRADLVKAVLEGTAYEIELARQAAGQISGEEILRIVAAGGGTHNPAWLQIKADVSGCPLDVPAVSEATLLGAALLAGMASGIYTDENAAFNALEQAQVTTYHPDPSRHAVYQNMFHNGYLRLQEPLREYYRYPFKEERNEVPTA